jgi:hypothetical protein
MKGEDKNLEKGGGRGVGTTNLLRVLNPNLLR